MKKLFIVTLGLLAGCASNPRFDCPLQEGGAKCKSLKEVSEMVKRGEVSNRGVSSNKSINSKNVINIAKASGVSPITAEKPERLPEKTLDVWLASYETEGIFHQENLITIVAEPARWGNSNGQ